MVMFHVLLRHSQYNTDVSIAILLSAALRKYCNALKYGVLLIPSHSGYVACRVSGPTVLLILD